MNKEKQIDWYQKELTKDKKQLERSKTKVIMELSGLSKEDILPKQVEKINIWERLKKVILG
ncbi:hypothetical protein N9E79_00895 [bacterium]|nr:hypothetical protein [bacterium]